MQPSDNLDMLRALGRDWRVIKRTRVETIYGLVELMDRALAAAPEFSEKVLILYGAKDDIIPGRPTFEMVRRLPATAKDRQTFALYDGGYHMLLRDLNAETVWRAILAWLAHAQAPLPSGSAGRAARALRTSPYRSTAGRAFAGLVDTTSCCRLGARAPAPWPP